MTIINENTVVVYNYDELKQVLEGNNNYTLIYFGDDITVTKGITISSNKANVVIDGLYNNVRHKYIDKKSVSTADVITVTSSTKYVIVKNMDITGYNYYGVIYVPDSTIYKDVIIEYNNITYVGPQISFHPFGLTRFISCDITIQDNYATGNEVAECNKIELGGNTTILHKSSGNSSFWFRNSNPSLTILNDATINFTSEKRELFYGVNNLNFTVSKNAKFYVTVYRGLAYNSFGTLDTLIDDNAIFSLKQTAHVGSYATWYSYGSITLNNNSVLSIINDYSSITSSNYNISFQTNGSNFVLNNPYKVILYNKVANIINTSKTINFDFSFTRLNLFDKQIEINNEISENTLPTYSWYKNELSNITGTFTNNTTTIKSNNYNEEELANLPSLSNFVFQNKKILSIGDFKIHMNALTDKDTEIKGITEPLASLLIKYNDVNIVTKADAGGFFSTSIPELPIGTIITIISKMDNDLIYHTKEIEIVFAGELILDSATKVISFTLDPIKKDPIICPRKDELDVIVTDSRVNSTNWKLYASINNDPISKEGNVLKDSLVFIDDNNTITPLSTTPLLVYTGTSNNNEIKITNVTWDDDKGILLKINDTLINKVEYSSIITWKIEE